MTFEWKSILLEEYIHCREFPGWAQIYEAHDQQDKEYFLSLEDYRESGFLITERI